MYGTMTKLSLVGIMTLALLTGLSQSRLAAGSPDPQDDSKPDTKRFLPLGKLGPTVGALGKYAQIRVPEGYLFIPEMNMSSFEDMTGNLFSNSECGALVSMKYGWFVIFDFNTVGFIKDDDKHKLGDAAGILTERKKECLKANRERRERGLDELVITSWQTPPYYDSELKSVAFGFRIRGKKDKTEDVNFESHILGRHGDMEVLIVASESEITEALSSLKGLLKGFSYVSGERYSDFRKGDKVAEYGLYALAAGGGIALLAKSGFLVKFMKPIILGAVALFAAIGNFFRRMFANKEY